MNRTYYNTNIAATIQWSSADTHHAYLILTENGVIQRKCRQARDATELMWVFIDMYGDGFEDVWADSVNWHQVYHEIIHGKGY